MSQKKTLILDEDDLIMVVKEDVVKQIDENRGELNRSEFVNYLIQYQLKKCFSQQDYVTKEEFLKFTKEIMELLHNFLQFFVSYGIVLGKQPPHEDLQAFTQHLEALEDSSGQETEEF